MQALTMPVEDSSVDALIGIVEREVRHWRVRRWVYCAFVMLWVVTSVTANAISPHLQFWLLLLNLFLLGINVVCGPGFGLLTKATRRHQKALYELVGNDDVRIIGPLLDSLTAASLSTTSHEGGKLPRTVSMTLARLLPQINAEQYQALTERQRRLLREAIWSQYSDFAIAALNALAKVKDGQAKGTVERLTRRKFEPGQMERERVQKAAFACLDALK